jgi:hypothetical protein
LRTPSVRPGAFSAAIIWPWSLGSLLARATKLLALTPGSLKPGADSLLDDRALELETAATVGVGTATVRRIRAAMGPFESPSASAA